MLGQEATSLSSSLSSNPNLGKTALISLSTGHYLDGWTTGGWGRPTNILEEPGLEQRRNSGQRRVVVLFFFPLWHSSCKPSGGKAIIQTSGSSCLFCGSLQLIVFIKFCCSQLCLLALSIGRPGHPGHPEDSVRSSPCGNQLLHSAAIKGPCSFLLDTWVSPPDACTDVTWGS